jgi:hypothetical protein
MRIVCPKPSRQASQKTHSQHQAPRQHQPAARRRAWRRVGCLHRFARATRCTGWNQSPHVSRVSQAWGCRESARILCGPNPAPGRLRTRFPTPRGKGTAHQSGQCGQVGPIITLATLINLQPRILLCSWRHCGVAVEGDAMKKIAAPFLLLVPRSIKRVMSALSSTALTTSIGSCSHS